MEVKSEVERGERGERGADGGETDRREGKGKRRNIHAVQKKHPKMPHIYRPARLPFHLPFSSLGFRVARPKHTTSQNKSRVKTYHCTELQWSSMQAVWA